MPQKYPTLIHERVEMCRQGTNDKTICRVSSGWVVIGDVQFLGGYCLLLADPVVPSLNDLNCDIRIKFMHEMSVLGDILLEVTHASLINYEILGNAEHALHAHLFPRYKDEPDEFKRRPAWMYDKDYRASITFDRERDSDFMKSVADGFRQRNLIIEQGAAPNP